MVKSIKPEQANQLLKGNDQAVYLDVRTESEFIQGCPAGALNIPVFERGALGMQPNGDFVDLVTSVIQSDQPVLCGCQSGNRSQRAAELLLAAGYAEVYNVLGGWGGGVDEDGIPVIGWREGGLPVSSGDDASTTYAAIKAKAGR